MSETHDSTETQLDLPFDGEPHTVHAILAALKDILGQLKDVSEWMETVDVRMRDIEENRY